MSSRVKKERNFLRLLCEDTISKEQGKAILSHVNSSQIRVLSEIVYNLLESDLNLSADFKHFLIKHRKKIEKLATRSTNLNEKKKIIKKACLIFLELLFLSKNILERLW